jgi:hypothetical protein
MEYMILYAIAAGGIFLLLVLVRIAPWFGLLAEALSRFVAKQAEALSRFVAKKAEALSRCVAKHLAYPYLLGRHRLIGPWTRLAVLLSLAYGLVNIFFVTFRASSSSEMSRRAGTLSLLNMALLYPFMQLGVFADVLGLSFDTCRSVHGAAAWMTSALLALHIVVAMLDQQKFSLHEQSNLFAVIV